MRRYVLATYDISDNKRLRKVFKLLRGYGEHIQYSVFLCQLTDKDIVVLSEKLKDIIHSKDDQVIMITLGPVEGKRETAPEKWRVLGMPLSLFDINEMIY